ncbi:MAG: aspartate aminotransferase family protein [bacterium]|jgi:putrescine aminotransferase
MAKELKNMNQAEKDRIVETTIEKYEKYLNPAMARIFKFMGLTTIEWEAQGTAVRDIYGKDFIDCAGGYGMFVPGHRHPKIVEAVKAQLERMPLSSKILLCKPMADLAELLAEITPGNLQYSFFCNSGAEANEGALKLARMATGKPDIVATVNAFHGKTMGALSASGRDQYKAPFAPLVPGFTHVPFNDAAAIEAAIGTDTAAVILEPIQGEGGVIVPDDNYLPAVREICDRKGVLLILDEVQTGFARTGKMFAAMHYGIAPDIMPVAKALGGGVMPIGAFIAAPRVWEEFITNPLIHTSTFGGNPIACAAGIATINVIREEKLAERALELGNYFLRGLREVQSRYPEVIAEVRGKGLLIGIEMTKPGVGGMIMSELIDRGILAVYTLNKPKVIRMEPPLVITTKQIDYVLEALDQAAGKCQAVIEEL